MLAQSAEMSVQTLENKLKSNPNSRVFSRLADAYRRRGDLRQAIDLCIEGLAQHPNYSTARLILGRCYIEQKNYSAAAGELKKVCLSDRKNHAAIKMLADIFNEQGQRERAGQLYHLLLEMEPENPSLRQLASQFDLSVRKDMFEILEISVPDVSSSMQNLMSSGVSEFTDVQNLDTIQSETPIAPIEQPTAEPTAQDVEDRLDLIFGEQETITVSKPDLHQEAPTEISGDDISSKMDELFSDDKSMPEPFGLQSADTIQLNRDELIESVPDFPELPAPDLVIETETAGNLFDFEAEETIQIDRSELGKAMERQSRGNNQADLVPQDIPLEPYEDGIDTPVENAHIQSPTGEDIIETLDNLFSEESEQKKEVTGDDVENRIDELFPLEAEDAAPEVSSVDNTAEVEEIAPSEEVTGLDLENRLVELFPESEIGENSVIEPTNFEINEVLSAPEINSKPDSEEVTGTDIEGRLEELFPESSEDKSSSEVSEINEILSIEDIQTPEEKGDDVTGIDVEYRLEELFPEKQEEASTPEPEISEVSDLEFVLENTNEFSAPSKEDVTGIDVEERLEELFPSSDSESSDKMELMDLDSNFSSESEASEEKSAPSSEDKVEGVDIEDRLEELFSDEKTSSESTAPSEIMSVESSTEMQPLEENISGDDVQERIRELFTSEDSVEPTISDIADTAEDDAPTTSDEIDLRDKPLSLPDHVLTPTLADIYYQQGQPHLALQIYERLQDRDPDDSSIQVKIREIQRFIELSAEENPQENSESVSEETSTKTKSASRRKKGNSENKPLAGVRIKKRDGKNPGTKRSK